MVGSAREAIHEAIYARIDAALNDAQRRALDGLLEHPAVAHLNTFSRLKPSPRPPTLKHRGQWTDRLAELDAILDPRPLLARMTPTKIRQFAAAAAALETGDLRDVCRPGRRHTLLLCLLATRNKAVERLQDVQAHQRETEERLLGVFWDGPEACR